MNPLRCHRIAGRLVPDFVVARYVAELTPLPPGFITAVEEAYARQFELLLRYSLKMAMLR